MCVCVHLLLIGVQLSPIPLFPQCYLPHVRSITAEPTVVSGGGVRIFLRWEETEKEDPELEYCFNARQWKARILSFSNAAAAPADFEVVNDDSVEWSNAANQSTNYSFPDVLSPDKYYSFQVSHQGGFRFSYVDRFGLKPITFASHTYFFGYQSMSYS